MLLASLIKPALHLHFVLSHRRRLFRTLFKARGATLSKPAARRGPEKARRLAGDEIGFLIGYEEPSSFFRAFREWTGETPQEARNAAVESTEIRAAM
jgi:AraC-like DNA-binding protein